MLSRISVKTAFLILVPWMLFAQVPDHFTNLTVLPKTISKEDLISVMRNFTEGLGVKCGFCHVEEEGQSQHKFDFSSDDKDNKKKARIMMKMINKINDDYISELKDFGSGNVIKVKCITCHHGLKEPKTLAQELNGVIKRKGIVDAISTYHNLYKQYYGGFAYNFEDNSLAELTHMLIEEKNYDAAIKISNLNIEQYPNSGLAYYSLGEAYEASGDKAKATENVKKAVELSPKNWMFNKKLKELQSSN
ncbi:MAG: c-type cytochrome [Ignavibacteriaceae bacterium]|jgi:tetratricopeptide (TPR) repeat protein